MRSWFIDRSSPSRRRLVVRGLQRDDFLASFGLPGTQHGTTEDEEGDDCRITPIEEDARQEEEMMKLSALVVARSS